MSDDPKTPENGAEGGSQGLPIPKLSEPSHDGPPSSGVDISAIAKQVAEQVKQELSNEIRMAQSTKDKKIAEIERKLNSGQFAELEALGAQIPENVKWEYRLRELEERSAQPSRKETSQGSGATLTAQDVSKVISDFALDANSPEVIEALRGTYRSREHFEATMARLAIARLSKPNPSPAAAPVGETSKTPSGDLQAEYESRRNKLATEFRGDALTRKLAELRVEMRGKGLSSV